MAQLLYLGKNQWITIDRAFVDGGRPPRNALIGGQVVSLTDGEPQKPTVFMAGDAFYYMDGQPVTVPDHVEHLPEPYKTMARKFIAKQHGGVEVKPLKVSSDKPTLKKRGRPKKSAGPIQVKDEASLKALAEGELEE